MTNDWYLIPTQTAGRLAIVPRPRGDDWVATDVEAWKRRGVTTAVSLLTADEAGTLGLEQEASIVEQNGMKYFSFPIDDRGIPENRTAFLAAAAELAQRITAGETVAIHCRQSIGRAPMMAIAVLQALGEARALETVSAARGRPVPETQEQEKWLAKLPTVTAAGSLK